jgi:hypothetical protein
MGDVNKDSLYFISGCICCYSGLYVDIPGCIGASGKGEFLCLEGETCIKADRLSKDKLILCSPCVNPDPAVICRLGLGCVGYALKKPTNLCKGQNQCFCCYGACALPTDAEVPSTCGLCFLALYPSVGCLKKVGELK